MASPAEASAYAADRERVELDQFLVSAAQSVAAARVVLRNQHVADLPDYWQEGATAPPDGTVEYRTANMVCLEIPGATGEQPKVVNVPKAALIQPNSLVLDSVAFDVECALAGFAPGIPGKIAIWLSKPHAGEAAMRVSLQFKVAAAPEGVMRISDVTVAGIR